MAAVGLLLCLGVPCSPRCPCRAANAASLLTATGEQAASLARAADAGIVDRAALERTTDAAGGAKDVLLAMHAACAAACAKGCRGCRVARLLNQTLRLERGVDDAVELGYFVDDERTMTALPEKLRAQAALAASIARSLRSLGTRCQVGRGGGRAGGGGKARPRVGAAGGAARQSAGGVEAKAPS